MCHHPLFELRSTAAEVMGNLLTVQIIPASIQDRDAAQHLLWRLLVTWGTGSGITGLPGHNPIQRLGYGD
jgi:hypothetical protein